jgi:5-methylcytosine-specific restriction endonuclease McrA
VARRVAIDRMRADDPLRKLYRTQLWRATRRLVLARDPFCGLCPDLQAPALSTIVHHVISARKYIGEQGGDQAAFFDQGNLQGVCKACHDATTARECGFAPTRETK